MTHTSHPWRRLGAVPADDLVEDRLVLHHAVQLIASFGQTLVDARADDSHRSMSWIESEGAFEGEATKDGLRPVLQAASLRLLLRAGAGDVGGFDLSGRSIAEARAWLGAETGAARGGGDLTLAWPEYELPREMPDIERPLTPRKEALAELARWYQDGFTALSPIVAGTDEASAIRCWPHHFDIATLLTFEPDGEQEARYVGVGLSPGDDSYSQPYFYVNGWPSPEPDALPAMTGPGAWHTRGWVGAVLSADAITEVSRAASQRERVSDFLTRAIEAMKGVVLRG